jgi:hypothetical protein
MAASDCRIAAHPKSCSPRLSVAALLLAGIGCGGYLEADTVFLKNGSLIDGIVTHRDQDSILLQIGSIGKLEIPLAEVYLIEKNKRIGGELLKSSVDVEGKIELVKGVKGSDSADGASKKAASKDAPAAVKKPKPAAETPGGDSEEVDESSPLTDDPVADDEKKVDADLKERIDALVVDLESENRKFRIRAERHLKAIGRPAIPSLIPLAKSKKDLTRVAVMRLFHGFGDERVIGVCLEGLNDINEYVRDHSNRALVRITGEDFGFQSNAPPRRREQAQAKWLKWWTDEQKALDEHRQASSRSGQEG